MCVCVCVCVCVRMYVYMYVFIYIYICVMHVLCVFMYTIYRGNVSNIVPIFKNLKYRRDD
jgi:hypothetical protein